MKKILLWDPDRPAAPPVRLTLDDAAASALVRAGVAAAADPNEAGALAAGAALDPANPVDVVLQHGNMPRTIRVRVPSAVAQLLAASGLVAG